MTEGPPLRADKKLVELGLCTTRTKAQQLIKNGDVSYNGKILKKPSALIDSQLENSLILNTNDSHYVGRGALKMRGAYEDFNLCFDQKVVADIGASTGGFTQFALEHGAQKVYAIDVGRDQLDPKLLEDKRVVNKEGVNIRYGIDLPELVDMAVVDLSFISLRLCLEKVMELLIPSGEVVVLFKPQFELGREALDSQGVVRSEELVEKGLKDLQEWCKVIGLHVNKILPCQIRGKMGNQEYFLYLKK